MDTDSRTRRPLSANQQRYWWMDELSSSVPVYNCPMGLRLRGALDLQSLLTAAQLVMDRHEALRTFILLEAGTPVQVIELAQKCAPPVEVVDLSTASDHESALREQIRQDLLKPFNLVAYPAWRLCVYRLGEELWHLHLNIHHIISDAWSIGVFFRDLSVAYEARAAGRQLWPPLTVSEVSGDGEIEWLEAQRYWVRYFEDPITTLQLPADSARPALATYRGGNFQWRIGARASGPLKRGAVDRGSTLYMALLTAYAVFLRRLTNQDEFVVGTMFSGRRAQEEWPLMGCFANSVVLRLRASEGDTYEDLLRRIRADVLSAHTYQFYPIQEIARQLRLDRAGGRNPLFSTLFIFQNTMGEFADLFAGLEVTPCFEEEYRSASECDLFLQVRERDGGLQLNFEYSADLFQPQTIERWAELFTAIVETIGEEWTVRFGDSVVLPEKHLRLLREWSGVDTPRLPARTVLQLIADVCERSPDATAIRCRGQSVSYAQLDALSDDIASWIRRLALPRSSIIGVCHERTPHMIAAMIGVMKAGCAYLPMDSSYPEARLQLMLADAGAAALITSSSLEQRVARWQVRLPTLLTDRTDELGAERRTSPASSHDSSPGDLAYVIFTSGSTGRPKGAAIEHGGLAALLAWAVHRLGSVRLSRVIASSSVCFDSSVFEIFAPLATGGTVELVDNALQVGSVSHDEAGLLLSCAPSVAKELLRGAVIGPGVQTVVLAGECVSADLTRDLYALAHVETVYNLYGLTEASVYSTWAVLSSNSEGPQPIGRPIEDTYIYLLDQRGKQVPIGAVGEIYLGGAGLAREYIGNPELTRERFVPDPFDPGKRLCRTGDLGRLRSDGMLVCLGRSDQQVKIRGFRIELGEVESALRQVSSISESVVLANEVPGTGLCLVAYVVPRSAQFDEQETRAALRSRLPEYMVPAYFVCLARIPLNSSGKVDRMALPPAVAAQRASAADVSSEPTLIAQLQSRIAEAWKVLLKRDSIDVHANLFEIGGHSLLLPRLRLALMEATGCDVAIPQFFVHPTIADLARHILPMYQARKRETPSVAASAAVGTSLPTVLMGQRKDHSHIRAEDLAIVAFSCRLPGASTPEELWANLQAKRNVITRVPPNRQWTIPQCEEPDSPDLSACAWGGWLPNVAEFDPEFFGMSMREARWTDPQQRLLLELAWEACERAGYRPSELSRRRVGVYVGASLQDYVHVLNKGGVLQDAYSASGNSLSMIANRVSYRLDFTGPSLTIDTACSSSLVALHLARQAMLRGDIDVALVGGVSLMCTPDNMVMWRKAGMLSGDGRCRPFDAAANGFGASEGGIVLLLKPLVEALRERDNVWAVLRGSAINHDGHSKMGLTVPNPKAQADVIREALEAAAVPASSMSLLEAHGTGTLLGDPVEFEALCAAYRQCEESGFCALDSVKAALGHLGPASGLAGVLTSSLALHYKKLPGAAVVRHVNPHLRLEGSSFYINWEFRDWPRKRVPLRAGVSSFGFGGTNAHVILEEHAPASPRRRDYTPCVLTLSARTPGALKSLARAYVDRLEQSNADELPDICYTSNIGREVFAHRLGMIARSIDQVVAGLTAYINGASDDALRQLGLCVGDARNRPAVTTTADISRDARGLIEGFVAGEQIDWSRTAPDVERRRVLLPTYPFDRRRCWVDPPAQEFLPALVESDPSPELNEWLKECTWASAPIPDGAERTVPSTCLLLDDGSALASTLRSRLQQLGAHVVEVPTSDAAEDARCANIPSEEDWKTALTTAKATCSGGLQILFFRTSALVADSSQVQSAELRAMGFALNGLARALGRVRARERLVLHIITGETFSVEAGQPCTAPVRAMAWGFAAAFQRESPWLEVRCTDVSRVGTSEEVDAVLAECCLAHRTAEIALRGQDRYTPRFRAVKAVNLLQGSSIRAHGIYLITGGLGGIGRQLALSLGRRYQATVVLTGRSGVEYASGQPADARALEGGELRGVIAEIEQAGGRVRIFRADVSNLASMQTLISSVYAEFGQLHGVFHLAGEISNQLAANTPPESFQAVLRAKVCGALVLSDVLRGRSIDFLVLFSSLASVIGNVFQAHYSAANRALDALAHWRAARAGRTLSINWPGWRARGMGAGLGNGEPASDDAAFGLISVEFGMALVEVALRYPAPQVIIARNGEELRLDPQRNGVQARHNSEGAEAIWTAELHLRRILGGILEVAPENLDAQTPFLDLGFDSILATRAVAEINRLSGVKCPRTLLFDYPTLAKLALHLSSANWRSPGRQEMPGGVSRSSSARSRPEASRTALPIPEGDAIAIIGMAGRLPGADDLEAFWHLIRNRGSAIGSMPKERRRRADADLSHGADIPPPHWKAGGFLSDIEDFDCRVFGIAPREAQQMDPQQRVLLEVVWEAIENAGYAQGQLKRDPTGVFVGASATPIHDSCSTKEISSHTLTANSVAVLANRISYVLDLHGPSMTIDTLCSSSLVAIHLAVQSLRRGECTHALVAAVRAGFPNSYYKAAEAVGALSPSGVCRAFDQSADGMVPGEGAVAVVLKPLRDALAAGDYVHAVILGSAVNHGGRGSGLVAPNAASQSEVIRSALADAHLTADTISLVEAHGTGTALGDPIEIDGLTRAFRRDTELRQFCAVGSVKPNIGHLEPAAGLAGLLKVVLAMRARELPPTINVDKPNSAIAFADSPFYLNLEPRPWKVDRQIPRRAGVSSFGIGGANAHVILQEAPAPTEPHADADSGQYHLLALSAYSDGALRASMERLAGFLSSNTSTSVADIAFSINTGRARFAHRAVVVGRSHGELAAALNRLRERDHGSEPAGAVGIAAKECPPPKIAFLFPGQASDLRGLVSALRAEHEVFRSVFDDCSARLSGVLQVPLLELAQQPGRSELLRQACFVQPLLFSIEYALAQLWRFWGVVPAGVLGHSLGEYAAAVTGGLIDLQDALELVTARGRLMDEHCLPDGGMAVVMASEGEVRDLLNREFDALEISVVNTPTNTVVSGARADLMRLVAHCEAHGMATVPLTVTHAFHSALMEPMLEPFAAAANAVAMRSPAVVYGSSRLGRTLRQRPSQSYWREHVREPVRYLEGIRSMIAEGLNTFVELGPGNVLTRFGEHVDPGRHLLWCSALQPGQPTGLTQLDSLGRLFVRGVDIDFSNLSGRSRRRVPLPTYPFDRAVRAGSTAQEPAVLQNASSVPPSAREHSSPTTQKSAQQGTDMTSAPPGEDLPTVLSSMIARALGVDPTSISQSTPLLELGADSLLLADVVRTIRERFAVEIATRELFGRLRTVAAIAEFIQGEIVSRKQAKEPVVAPPQTFVPYRRVQPHATERLEREQKRYLERFVASYVERTQRSKAYARRFRKVLADSRGVAGFRFSIKEMLYPIVGDRSAGSYMWDIDGNRYVDISMGYGVHLFGHRPTFISEAIQAQLAGGVQIGPQANAAGEAAELLCELTGSERVTFCNSGTEAVMLAVRLARNATGRGKVVIFEGCYHGFYDGSLMLRNAQTGLTTAMAPGLPPSAAEDIIVLPYANSSALSMIEARTEEIAAVLVEPVQSRRPDVQPLQFLTDLRAITARHGIALVFDEVITGFRVHPGGAQARFGIRADLAIYGKILGGGFPIGAVAGRAEFMNGVDGGRWTYGDDSYPGEQQTFFATTFGKHPLVMATTLATLKEMRASGPQLQQGLSRRTTELAETLNASLAARGVPIEVKHFSSLFRFQSSANIDLLYYQLLARGIYVWEGRNFFLSTAHTSEDISQVYAATEQSVDELIAAGLLESKRRASQAPGHVSLPRGSNEKRVPLSVFQADLLLSHELAGDAPMYNESVAIVLKGTMNLQAMRTACQRLIARHELLRGRLLPSYEEFRILAQDANEVLEPLAVRGMGAADDPTLAHKFAKELREEARRPFDLCSDSLCRMTLWSVDRHTHVLLLTTHHLIADAVSNAVLIEELAGLYSSSDSAGVAAEPLQYEQWVRDFERERGARPSSSRDYWLERFRDIPPQLMLPFDRPPFDEPALAGRCARRTFGPELARLVRDFAARVQVTPFAVLLAAFNVLLYRLTRQRDLTVGVPISLHPGAATALIGHCINRLPIRTQVADDTTFEQYARQVRDAVFDANDHADFSFGELVRALSLRNSTRWSPLINVEFNADPTTAPPRFGDLRSKLVSLNAPMDPLDLELPNVAPVELDSGTTKLDFTLSVLLTAQELRAVAEFRSEQLDLETVNDWLGMWGGLLARLLQKPAATLEAVLLAEAASAQGSNGGDRPVRDVVGEIWSEVLRVALPKDEDDFFALGGHSLFAMQVVSRIAKRMGVRLSIRDLFRNPRFDGFVSLVARALVGRDGSKAMQVIL